MHYSNRNFAGEGDAYYLYRIMGVVTVGNFKFGYFFSEQQT